MKKTIILFLILAAAMVAAGQTWQYCEVTSFTGMKGWSTITNMDTIAPPTGIVNNDKQKWTTNAEWLNKFGADGWELVATSIFTGQSVAIRYTFKRKRKQ